MKKVDFDNFVDDYDKLLRKDTGFFSKCDGYFAEYKVRIARETIDFEPSKILEYGCGTGRNIAFLKAYFPTAEIHGSDVSPKSITLAKSSNPESVFYIENGGFEATVQYDLIFVAGVFHHIQPDSRNEVLENIRCRLTPKGRLIVFEHNPYNLVTRRIVNNCVYDTDAVILTSRELVKRLKTCGFKICKRSYTLFFPEWLGFFSRAERYLGWLPLGGQYFVIAK